ncbi:MAG: RluA family pseudouridine synthase [Rhodothermales bacterium]
MEETLVTFDVPPGYREGERLDVYLTGFIQNATRTKVQKGIKDGRVEVNGKIHDKPSYVVQAGDRIACRLPRPPALEIVPEDLGLDIVYEDDDLIIVDKPAGMVVHPAYGHRSGTLLHGLLHHLGAGPFRMEDDADADADDDADPETDPGLSTVNAAPRFEGDVALRPGIVHRLDKDTSGLLVIAKNDIAHARLAAQFADHTINRHYIALVWGIPAEESGTIRSWLGRDRRDRRRVSVTPEGTGKHAVTHWKRLESFADTSLLEFRLETGRTHQIRVHSSHMGHAIFGDTTYDGDRIRYGRKDGSRKGFYRNLFKRLPRQALHAASLGFVHPTTGREVYFESPLPDDMTDVVQRVRANLTNVFGGEG